MLSFKELLLPLAAVALVISPLFFMFKNGTGTENAKVKLISQISIFSGVFLIAVITQIGGMTTLAAGEAVNPMTGTLAQGLGFLGAALATGFSSLGAGIAVAGAAPAAIGAISENGDNFGRSLIFVALGEGVAIYGLLISILIINSL
jgi:V/A-type H+-transporting ATPase subunit K